MSISRRSLLKGVAASAAIVMMPTMGKAQDVSVHDFYVKITTDAFQRTFPDTDFSSITSYNGLLDAINGTGDAYIEHYYDAASEYFKNLSQDQQANLLNKLKNQPTKHGRDNLLGAVKDDIEGYNAGNPNREQTNPYFLMLFDLKDRGIIDADEHVTAFQAIIDLTHGDKRLESFHNGLVEHIQTSLASKSVPESRIQPSAPKL